MENTRVEKVKSPKRRENETKQISNTKRTRTDSLIRTKAVLNAALRVWELKRRLRSEYSA